MTQRQSLMEKNSTPTRLSSNSRSSTPHIIDTNENLEDDESSTVEGFKITDEENKSSLGAEN